MRILRRHVQRRTIAPGIYTAGDPLPVIRGDVFGTATEAAIIDLIEACLPQTGRAHVTIATWTSSQSSTEHAQRLLLDARLLSLTFVVDETFPTRQPDFCQSLLERFGRDALRLAKTHAKFALVQGTARTLSLVPSVNLNRHAQLETFDAFDDEAIAELLAAISREAKPCGIARDGSLFGDGLLDRDLRRVGLSTRAGLVR